jgi:hypothetical protein
VEQLYNILKMILKNHLTLALYFLGVDVGWVPVPLLGCPVEQLNDYP